MFRLTLQFMMITGLWDCVVFCNEQIALSCEFVAAAQT